MSFVTVDSMKEHLNLTTNADCELIEGKIAAAEDWIELFVGADFATDYEDGIPGPMAEAIKQLAAHFYENREATLIGESAERIPFGVYDLLSPYRCWVF